MGNEEIGKWKQTADILLLQSSEDRRAATVRKSVQNVTFICTPINAQQKKMRNFPTQPTQLFAYISVYTATFFVKLGNVVADSFVSLCTFRRWSSLIPGSIRKNSLVPRPLPRKAERGSGVLSDISCHMGRGRTA